MLVHLWIIWILLQIRSVLFRTLQRICWYMLGFCGSCSGFARTFADSADHSADTRVQLRICGSGSRFAYTLAVVAATSSRTFLVHAVDMLFALRIPWKLLQSPWKFFLAVSPTRPSAVSRLPNVAGGMNCCARHLVSLFLHAFASELGNGAWISLGRWRRSHDISVRGSFALPSTLMGEGLGGCCSQSCHGYLRALLELVVLPSNHLPPS